MKKVYTLLLAVFSVILFIQVEWFCLASKSAEFRYFFRDTPEELLAELSIEEKVGQIMIYGFAGDALDRDYEAWLADGNLGSRGPRIPVPASTALLATESGCRGRASGCIGFWCR